jgi:hypothetical protein
MSTDFNIRPVGTPALSPVIPPSPAATDAVATELPPTQSVTVVDPGASPRNDQPQSSANVSHQVVFDSAAASFVFQVLNADTEQVVTQFPDEAMLRRRAYFHALDLSKAGSTRPLATDRSA